jgi:hypothetical protein
MGHSLLGGLSWFPAGIEDVTMVELCAIGTDGGDGVFGLAFSALFKRLDLSGLRAQVVKDRTGGDSRKLEPTSASVLACPRHAHPIPPNHARLEGLCLDAHH